MRKRQSGGEWQTQASNDASLGNPAVMVFADVRSVALRPWLSHRFALVNYHAV